MAKAALASPPAAIALLPTEQLPTRQTTFVPVVRANTLLPTANDDRVNPAVPTKRLAPDCEASPVPVLTNRLFLISFPEPVGARARVVTDVHRRHAAAARVVDEEAVPELEVRHRRRRDAARSVQAEEVRIRVDPRRDVEEVVVHSDVVRRRIREGVEVDVRVADVDEVVAVLGQHAGGAGELDGRAERLEDRTASPAFPRAASPSPATQCNRDRILVHRRRGVPELRPVDVDAHRRAVVRRCDELPGRERNGRGAGRARERARSSRMRAAGRCRPPRRSRCAASLAVAREIGALVPDPWSKDYAATRPAPAAPAS